MEEIYGCRRHRNCRDGYHREAHRGTEYLEREAADFPKPWALARGAGKEGPTITTPSGINGNVQLVIC